MRTPGRCSNIEGCWISASQRDVWLTVGEDFTCPNCGGALSPPPGRSVSMIGLKRVALTGVAATMAVAAMAAVTVRMSTPPSHLHAAIMAMLPGSGSLPARHPQQPQSQRLAAALPLQGPAAIGQPNQATPPRVAGSIPAEPQRSAMASTATAPPEMAWPPRAGSPAPAPVPFYTAPSDPAPVLAQTQHQAGQSVASLMVPRGSVPRSGSWQGADRGQSDMASDIVTVIAQTKLVPSPSTQRPLVLDISFGAPRAPETDAAPANTHWRHHGLVRRRSYFLPGPGQEDVHDICPTPAPLP